MSQSFSPKVDEQFKNAHKQVTMLEFFVREHSTEFHEHGHSVMALPLEQFLDRKTPELSRLSELLLALCMDLTVPDYFFMDIRVGNWDPQGGPKARIYDRQAHKVIWSIRTFADDVHANDLDEDMINPRMYVRYTKIYHYCDPLLMERLEQDMIDACERSLARPLAVRKLSGWWHWFKYLFGLDWIL